MDKVLAAAEKGDNVLKVLLQNGANVKAVNVIKRRHFTKQLSMGMLTLRKR